jgi:hypothetical protein
VRRAAVVLAAATVAIACAPSAGARAQTEPPARAQTERPARAQPELPVRAHSEPLARALSAPVLAFVEVASRAEAEAYLGAHPSAVALGVFPERGHDFLAQFELSARTTTWRDLDDRLRDACVEVVDPASSFAGTPQGCATAKGTFYKTLSLDDAAKTNANLTIVAGGIGNPLRANLPPVYAFTVGVLGLQGSGAQNLGARGLLDAGDTGRAGIVTPYDLAATVLRFFGLPTPGLPGNAIHVAPARDPLARVRALRARFERDAGADAAPSQTTAGFGIFAGFVGALAALRGRKRIANAIARGGVLVPIGYLAGMFFQTGSGALRAVPVGVAFGAGVLANPKDSRRFCGVACLVLAGSIAALTVAAALHPGGEPALSLWGNPLTSWRFFGLRNHLAAFVAGGALLGAHLLRWSWRATAAAALAALAIVGTPKLGANYIGVLTLAFAAALMLSTMRKPPKLWHVAAALATGAAATATALLSDSVSPVSHGGRAVAAIHGGGVSAGWRIFHDRLVLDYREVAGVGLAGPIAVVLIVLWMGYFFGWAWRAREAAVCALAAATILTLFVEDSGFYTAGTLSLFPAIGFVLAFANGELTPARASGGARTT